MRERWREPSPDAIRRRTESLEGWLCGSGIDFTSPEAKAAYQERATLFKDALEMTKPPSRVPVYPSPGHFPLEYAGVGWREAMYDYAALGRAWHRYYDDFGPDAYLGPGGIVPGRALDGIGLRLYRWAGHGLADDQEYQFVEREYMTAEDYPDLIDDPTGFFLNVYAPRVCDELQGLHQMPLLPPVHEIIMFAPALFRFSMPEVKAALEALVDAGDEAARWLGAIRDIGASIMGRGLPSFAGGISKAPFDVIGDSLRGTQGVMLDMFRHPDELLEACERLVPLMVRYGVESSRAVGHVVVFMPLHKGADGFMSNAQFERFYWPTLRKVAIGLIDAGLVPQLFAEGGYEQRLEVISDLPKGTTLWWFDRTDMARAKRTVGRVACLSGNVPLDLLCTGTTDDVEQYCRTLIDAAGEDGGFILSTGAGMQGSKAANVKAMIDFSKEYGVYR